MKKENLTLDEILTSVDFYLVKNNNQPNLEVVMKLKTELENLRYTLQSLSDLLASQEKIVEKEISTLTKVN
jgi:hypothetical protein